MFGLLSLNLTRTPLFTQQGEDNRLVGLPESAQQYYDGGIFELISNLLGVLVIVAGIFLFLCILISGVQWMLAGGNAQTVEQARSRLTTCLIGFTVLALSFAVTLLVQFFFGISIFNFTPGNSVPEIPEAPDVSCQAACQAAGRSTGQCLPVCSTPFSQNGPNVCGVGADCCCLVIGNGGGPIEDM